MRKKQKRRKRPPTEPALLSASLASGAVDPYTLILLALAHCAASAGITLDCSFLSLEDKLAAITRALEQHPEAADFIAVTRLLIAKIRAESEKRECGTWTN